MASVEEFSKLVKQEMGKYGLFDKRWNFKFDRAKKRLGLCSYVDRTLYFSLPFVELNEVGIMHNTVLHEIAHALTPGSKHGTSWKDMARKIGAVPSPYCVDPRIISPKGPFMMKCKCTTYYFHRSDTLHTRRKCLMCNTSGMVVTSDNTDHLYDDFVEKIKQNTRKPTFMIMQELMK